MGSSTVKNSRPPGDGQPKAAVPTQFRRRGLQARDVASYVSGEYHYFMATDLQIAAR
jgi:hypothetical protein